MKAVRVLCAVLLLVGAGCSMFTESSVGSSLEVEATGSVLRLTNHTEQPVYYLAFEREMLALALWAPCTNPQECPRIAPGEQISVGYESISGYEAGKQEAVVLWYHLHPDSGGGFEPDSLRSVVVRL
ncbi:hypothetical protein BH23GEM7_BH23GEM7_35290 [soil metagenome]